MNTNTLERAAVPSLAAGLLLAAFAAPAAAQAPSDSTATRVGNAVTITVRGETPNPVKMRVDSSGSLIIEDSAGITAGPGCTRSGTGNTAVNCGPASTVTRLSVALAGKA
ncbi:hypothetical protein [Streptomyces sp. NL15-2K]|uniref:hypothetical protein n=1 Tax=Streptomyces sp. NL15-2K TaxID=376149 RepID=UPI000F56112C|nr:MULTISPECIES: hypothetical protein [Actinomycetes]WKX08671.1 hypothetical protein Q4V64_14715 [Kutzneria buriramensis]